MLWGMINVMQIIVKMPLFNINFPSNAQTFYTFITSVSNFDILPTAAIEKNIFHFQEDQTDSSFDTMGYGSNSMIDNLGSAFLYLIGFVAVAAFVLLIRFLKNRY